MGRNSGLNPQVVILRRDQLGSTLVLLVKRSDTGVWTLPGGRRELGEDLAVTAVRETKEETGYEIKLVRPLGTYDLPQLPALGKVFVFVGEITSGEAKMDDEISAISWFPTNHLPALLLPYHQQKIKDAVEGKVNIEVNLPHTIFDIIKHYWWTPIILIKMMLFYRYLAKRTKKI